MKKIDKRIFKKNKEELEEYMKFSKKHHIIPSRKGKGSFKRNKEIREEDLFE